MTKPAAPPVFVGTSDHVAHQMTSRVLDYLEEHHAQFIVDETGLPSVVIGSERIDLSRTDRNLALSTLYLRAGNFGTQTAVGRLVTERLSVHARSCARRLTFRSFGAHDASSRSLYVPLKSGDILEISATSTAIRPNGHNGLWLTHPTSDSLELADSEISRYVERGLPEFERLIVETQACAPALQWWVSLHAALLPFVRDLCPARMIVVHQGPSQHGKTSGAQRFMTLHGLGLVLGDFSPAALGNQCDPGLLVLDNVEQADLSRELSNYLLFLSTAAKRGRSDQAGQVRTSSGRPVGLLTSIEGISRQELRNRCVEVPYRRPSDACLPRFSIETRIAELRDTIRPALLCVIQRFLRHRISYPELPPPVPAFGEYWLLMTHLLMAYGEVSGKGLAWAFEICHQWSAAFTQEVSADPGDELEFLIWHVITQGLLGSGEPHSRGETEGWLYRTNASSLLSAIHTSRMPASRVPSTPVGLGRRLRSTRFASLVLIESGDDPSISRTVHQRQFGLFLPEGPQLQVPLHSRSVIAYPSADTLTRLTSEDLAQHAYLSPTEVNYFLWQYVPGDGSPPERLLHDMKLDNTSRLPGVKQRAIDHISKTLSLLLPSVFDADTLYVPMPPSKMAGGPHYDPRIEVLLRQIIPRVHVASLLRLRADTPARQKGLTPDQRKALLEVVPSHPSECRTIVVVDDCLASGSHFAAARQLIHESYPGTLVIGLFLVRRQVQLARAASAG